MRRPALALAVGLCATLGGARLEAQDTLRVTVHYIAGANVYLGAGGDAGIQPGDTLLARKLPTGEALGALVVISTSTTRSVVAFVGTPASLTRGDVLAVTVRKGAAPSGPAPVMAEVPTAAPSAPQRRREPTQVVGRLSLDVDGTHSVTTGLGADPERDVREFGTTSAGLWLRARRLPGGFEVNTNLRTSYRASSADIIDPTTLVEVYEANLAKDFGSFPFQFRVGRFFNPYETFSGYWDGLLLHAGRDGFGVGAIVGYEPDRGNSGFSQAYPKATAFLNLQRYGRGASYRTDLSVHRVFPEDSVPEHTYFGWSQDIRLRSFSVSHSLQVDRNPESARWAVSRLLTRVTLRLGNSGTLYAGYGRRHPYILGPTTDVFSHLRNRINGGATLWLGGGSLGVDVSTSQQDGLPTYWAYTGSAMVLRSPLWGLGLSANATYWREDLSHGLLLAPSVSRQIGLGDVRLRYQFYRTRTGDRSETSHALDLGTTFPLGSRTQATLRGQFRTGDYLSSTGLYAGVWYSF